MSKEAWFQEFERQLAERDADPYDDEAYEAAARAAEDALADRWAARADHLRDEAKYEVDE